MATYELVVNFLLSHGFSLSSAQRNAHQTLSNIEAGNAPGGWFEWLGNVQAANVGGGNVITGNVITDNVAPPPLTPPPSPANDPEIDPMNGNGFPDVDFGFDRPAGFPEGRVLDVPQAQQALIGAGLGLLARFLPAIAGAVWRAGTARTLRVLPNWQIAAAFESVDLALPGVDLPSPSDIPEAVWELAKNVFALPFNVADPFLPGRFPFTGGGGGGGGGGGAAPPGVGAPGAVVVNSWVANGRPFYQLSDGWTWVQRKNGSWKRFKQPKPIVLFANGSSDLKTMLRGAKAIQGQLKRIDKALGSRLGPRRRRAPAKPPTRALYPDGRIVNIDNS